MFRSIDAVRHDDRTNLELRESDTALELGRALTALSSEINCVTLLCLSDGIPRTAHYLYTEFQAVTDSVSNLNPRRQAGCCDTTLIPNGYVTLEGNQYSITPRGLEIGVPAAAHLVTVSETLPFSIKKLLGATNSSRELTSPIARAAILEYLFPLQHQVQELDLERDLAINRKVLGPHLSALASLGVIDYRSVDFENIGMFQYKVSGTSLDKVPVFPHRPTLTRQVISVLPDGPFDVNLITQLILEKYPLLKTLSLSSHIGQILSWLESQHVLSQGTFKSGDNHSVASINNFGRDIFTSVLVPLRAMILEGDPTVLNQMKSLDWRVAAPNAVSRYIRDSGYVKHIPIEILADTVLTYIKQKPGLRPRDLKRLIRRSPFDVLKYLEDMGLIIRIKDRKFSYYYFKPSTE